MTITADGGWITFILILACLFVGIMAYRKRWPRQRAVAVGGNVPTEQRVEVVKTKTRTRFVEIFSSIPFARILLWAIGIALLVFLVIKILHLVASSNAVQPMVTRPVSVGPTENGIRESVRAERAKTEGEQFVITPMFGEQRRWIHVPDGGFVTVFTVDDNKVVGVQCSSSIDEPPIDASGDAYECNDAISAHWIRFSAWSTDEGPLTIRYHFHYAY